MKKLIFCLIAAIGLLMQSCGALKSYYANYSIGLSSVESPANAKQQYGETKVVNFKDGEISKYRYEDNYINIVWYVSQTRFNFDLTNKSGHTIKINWDDVSYVDIDGKVGRVMHAGVKYVDRNSSQPATTIPKNATISDLLTPTDNVYYSNYIGWTTSRLIPSYYSTQESLDISAPGYVGKKMTILMPIMIENIQNDYVFEFSVDELL